MISLFEMESELKTLRRGYDGRSAAAVDACSFRNGGEAHDSLLYTLAVYARLLVELRVNASKKATCRDGRVVGIKVAMKANYTKTVVARSNHAGELIFKRVGELTCAFSRNGTRAGRRTTLEDQEGAEGVERRKGKV